MFWPALLTALAAAWAPPRAPPSRCGSRAPARLFRLCAQEEPPKLDEDWRAFRARLVAAQQAEGGGEGGASTTSEGGYMYATPLIEQGSVILGGTQQEFGFALRQQYFHKSVMLLLQHDDGFTKGIILNRPSAITLDGWRLWFGGDVAQGGLFRRAAPWRRGLPDIRSAASGLEMVCLHSLPGDAAQRLSLPVISGVWRLSHAGKGPHALPILLASPVRQQPDLRKRAAAQASRGGPGPPWLCGASALRFFAPAGRRPLMSPSLSWTQGMRRRFATRRTPVAAAATRPPPPLSPPAPLPLPGPPLSTSAPASTACPARRTFASLRGTRAGPPGSCRGRWSETRGARPPPSRP